jgi:predicted nucleic acid-binding protein
VDRVFLDANVLFSAAYRDGAGLVRLWELPGVALLTSGYAAEEARRNLAARDQRQRLEVLLRRVTVVAEPAEEPLPNGLVLPDKDKPIFLAALSAGSSHLLTGDLGHFGEYFGHTFSTVLILPPGSYLRERGSPG